MSWHVPLSQLEPLGMQVIKGDPRYQSRRNCSQGTGNETMSQHISRLGWSRLPSAPYCAPSQSPSLVCHLFGAHMGDVLGGGHDRQVPVSLQLLLQPICSSKSISSHLLLVLILLDPVSIEQTCSVFCFCFFKKGKKEENNSAILKKFTLKNFLTLPES